MKHAALLLTLALAAPALAQDAQPDEFLPLSELTPAEGVLPEGRTRLMGVARDLAQLVPGLSDYAVPTTGSLRLAVILVEFPDQPRPAEFHDPAHWERALFSRDGYAETPSGEQAYGSLADYYHENSGGRLQVEGKVFDWVRIPRRRAELERMPAFLPGNRNLFYGPALDALRGREGADVLDEFHALVFVPAGGWAAFRGSLLWPHASALLYGGRAWGYYVMHAGEPKFEGIGVHCHELGHVLGIFDKYGIGAGGGLGQWCSMANGAHGGRSWGVSLEEPTADARETIRRAVREQVRAGLDWVRDRLDLPERKREESRRRITTAQPYRPSAGDARPLHYCSVCKTRLGWSEALPLDPRQPRKLYLTPIEEDPDQVVRVLLDGRGRESLFLAYRKPVGFDADLPREGLIVWRTGSPGAALRTFVPLENVELIPAHGQRSVDAALREPARVPFPDGETTSVRVPGLRQGAWTAVLEEIRLEDGKLYLELRAEERERRGF